MNTRILLVDDEPALRQMFATLMRCLHADWDIEVADNGHQALHLLEQQSFDVVISDMRMPGMTGAELMQKVSHHHPRTVRIIFSAYADDDLRRQSASFIHQWLAKPCPGNVLCKAVEKACSLASLLKTTSLAA